MRECWSIMTQENPICYENTSGNERGYNQEDREGSINTLCKTTSAHDRLVHENGCALALIKCLIWTCFVSLIVIALWILMYWRQPPGVVDLSTNKGWHNAVIIVLIGITYGLCLAFCTFFDSAIPGNTPPSPFIPKRSQSYTYSRLAVNGSTDYDSDPFPPPNDENTPSLKTVTTPVYRSGSLSIEYLTVPFNVVFVIVAVLLWLRNEMGVTIF